MKYVRCAYGSLGRPASESGTLVEKPRLFIGSSVEGLSIAEAIHQNLERVAEITT